MVERTDQGLFSAHTEVLCARCHSHLGHVFFGEVFSGEVFSGERPAPLRQLDLDDLRARSRINLLRMCADGRILDLPSLPMPIEGGSAMTAFGEHARPSFDSWSNLEQLRPTPLRHL